MLKALLEILELTLVVACLGVALRLYVRHHQPTWSGPLKRRRLAVGWALVLGVLATKVTEDVLDDESGPIDKALLGMIGERVSHGSTSVFDAITVTGSADVLTPLAVVATLALLAARAWAVTIAIMWTTLVAVSRLALGVHWPTDVLAAACIGASLPLGFSLAFDVRRG